MSRNEIINVMNDWLAEHYGSHRGFARTLWHRVRFISGGYRSYQNIEWSSVERLVFICKGNICRSAFAQAFANSLGTNAISCGIDTGLDLPANPDAIRVAREKGVDLKVHATTPIQTIEIHDTDLFLAMEPWQAEYILQAYENRGQCSLLGIWSTPVTPYIHDPFGMSDAYFGNCFDLIEKSVHEVAEKIKKKNSR